MSFENNSNVKSIESDSVYNCSCKNVFFRGDVDDIAKTTGYEPRKDSSILQCKSFKNMLSAINITQNQMMMLIYNYMMEKGYKDIAQNISEKTGISTNDQTFTKLVNLINSRNMNLIVNTLDEIIPFESKEIIVKIKKVILIHFYTEYLNDGDYISGLNFLRKYSHKVSLYPEEAFELTT